MRVRCPACAAPYFLPEEPPPDAQCPNCEAPAPVVAKPVHPQRPRQQPEPEGDSRAVTVVGLLHLLVASNGLCLFVGMSAVVGEHGADPVSVVSIFFGAAWAVAWASVGLGILRRWQVAWGLSFALTTASLLLLAAARYPLGAACNALVCVGILVVLIARRREFR